jgi:hypothetical protein
MGLELRPGKQLTRQGADAGLRSWQQDTAARQLRGSPAHSRLAPAQGTAKRAPDMKHLHSHRMC